MSAQLSHPKLRVAAQTAQTAQTEQTEQKFYGIKKPLLTRTGADMRDMCAGLPPNFFLN
jgi:hypothetical protein